MNNNIQEPELISFWAPLKNSKLFVVSVWIISMILGYVSLQIYLSTSALTPPDSAADAYIYNLCFFPVFLIASAFASSTLLGFLVLWHTSKAYSRVKRVLLLSPLGLIISPVVLQGVFIVLKLIAIFVFGSLYLVYIYIRLAWYQIFPIP